MYKLYIIYNYSLWPSDGPYDIMRSGYHLFGSWHVTFRYQAITWTNGGISSIGVLKHKQESVFGNYILKMSIFFSDLILLNSCCLIRTQSRLWLDTQFCHNKFGSICAKNKLLLHSGNFDDKIMSLVCMSLGPDFFQARTCRNFDGKPLHIKKQR